MAKKRITAASQYTDPVECDGGYVSISIAAHTPTFDMTIVLQRRRPGEGDADWHTFATYDDDVAVEETSLRMGGTWEIRAGSSAWTSGTADVEVVV